MSGGRAARWRLLVPRDGRLVVNRRREVAGDAGDDRGQLDRGRGVVDEVDEDAEIDGGERECRDP
jgi:hypothetical protein